ncbi:MAG: protein kinase domain-containing protein, partial [Mycobacteriales bacterium]
MPSVARAGGAAAGVDDPLVGVVLDGRYRIESRLARGGMSTVFTGTDLRLDRSVALKVMDAQLAGDPQFAGRFARGARAAARLSHVNVVAVHDQGEDAGHAFLVMELVRGRTLRDLIREHGRVSPELAIAITEPVLAALAAAHRAHLVHRDIKPENVLLGDDGVVKVADFGLARALADLSSTAENSAVMGTAAYVAPEQITRGATTPRTDVYSTGIVLFEMVTGRAPFAGGSSVSTAYRHVHEDVPAPSARVAGLPRALDALVVRATRRDPAARPADAAEFLARLHDARHAAGLR